MIIPKIFRIPTFLKWCYPSWYIWDKKSTTKTIYLTFDDGPIPEVTEFVLDTLSRKRISKNPIPATFFCIGDNVCKHATIFKRIIAEGHAVGNHTYNHLKGITTDNETYLKNIQLANLEITKHIEGPADSLSTPLFRPPYGRIKREQAKALHKRGYNIIMYRVIGFDWNENISTKECLNNITKKTKSGDIIVLHDSTKAFKNMKYALPLAIDYFLNQGFEFKKL